MRKWCIYGKLNALIEKESAMGILTRKQGEMYVISSDHTADGPPAKRAPQRMSETYYVWNGERWSSNVDEAITFASLDDADEYVRANYGKVSG
jgi:hypothetical protein